MAVGTRRTRLLVANGRRFRWRCDFAHPTEIASAAFQQGRLKSPDRLLIRPEDAPNELLTVTWPACCGPAMRPGVVRGWIDFALQNGWSTEEACLTLDASRFVESASTS